MIDWFSEKEFKILSILLSSNPLSTTEIAALAGYPRKTVEPYINQFVETGYLKEYKSESRIHAWALNKSKESEILDRFTAIENEIIRITQKHRRSPIWVHLIDVDSKIPNLALMKVSAFHKAHGDRVTISKGFQVGFCDYRSPDQVYISVIFKKNKPYVDQLVNTLRFQYPDTEIDIGGSGWDLKTVLPYEIENMQPDYSLYPNCDYSIGFSSRGCIRNTKTCPFCIVPIKEGKFRRTDHPETWYNPAFDKIVFLDNNILADKEWFMEITAWCIEKNLKVWFTQGLDIRRTDAEIAKRLLEMRKYKSIFFAWDHIEDEAIIKEKIELLKAVGFSNAMLRTVQFYVYVDSDSDAEYDSGVYRARELKKLSCGCFIMYNIDNPKTQRIIDLQRWANRKQLFWSLDIHEYIAGKRISHRPIAEEIIVQQES